MDNKRILAVASLKKRNILKGGAFDIHKAIGKLPRPRDVDLCHQDTVIWVQTTPLEEQLDENDNPLPGHEPIII